jgi:hypothetical protein
MPLNPTAGKFYDEKIFGLHSVACMFFEYIFIEKHISVSCGREGEGGGVGRTVEDDVWILRILHRDVG